MAMYHYVLCCQIDFSSCLFVCLFVICVPVLINLNVAVLQDNVDVNTPVLLMCREELLTATAVKPL